MNKCIEKHFKVNKHLFSFGNTLNAKGQTLILGGFHALRMRHVKSRSQVKVQQHFPIQEHAYIGSTIVAAQSVSCMFERRYIEVWIVDRCLLMGCVLLSYIVQTVCLIESRGTIIIHVWCMVGIVHNQVIFKPTLLF